MDIQISVLFIVLPFLQPLFSKRYYKITSTDYENLLNNDEPKKSISFKNLVAFSVGTTLILRIFPISSWRISHSIFSYLLLGSIGSLMCYCCWKSSPTPAPVK